jgi:regulator of protease activity HflC (stomatin/prohibitin superfamily)
MELMIFEWLAYAVPILLLLLLLFASVWIFREYERGVIFTLGRFTRVGGPGWSSSSPSSSRRCVPTCACSSRTCRRRT